MIADLATDIQSLPEFLDVPVDPVIAQLGATEAVSIAVNDGQGVSGFNSVIDYKDSNVDINIYADTYGRMREMKDALVARYDGFSGTLGSTQFKRTKIVNLIETADSSNPPLYRAIVLLETTT